MPNDTLRVDRRTIFGNPFGVKEFGRPKAVMLHRMWLLGALSYAELTAHFSPDVARELVEKRRRVLGSIPELRGKNVACWCPIDEPCHANLLLQLANGESEQLAVLLRAGD